MGGAQEKRWREQEGRKKYGVRDVEELKEMIDRLILGKGWFLLQCSQQKICRCCEHPLLGIAPSQPLTCLVDLGFLKIALLNLPLPFTTSACQST